MPISTSHSSSAIPINNSNPGDPPSLAELTEILGRRKFEKKVAASRLSVDQLVEGYAQLAALVRPAPVPRLAPDPDDEVVLATALAAKAEFIVTGDRTLRSLVEYQHVKLVRVREALQTLQSQLSRRD